MVDPFSQTTKSFLDVIQSSYLDTKGFHELMHKAVSTITVKLVAVHNLYVVNVCFDSGHQDSNIIQNPA